MKVYINNRNYLTWPKAAAEYFLQQNHEVIFIDNDSTFEPLLEWYQSCKLPVHYLSENVGHTAPWKCKLVDLSGYYAVTDPDLSFTGIPSDWPEVCQEGIEKFNLIKCGFSLDESQIPERNPAWYEDTFYLYPDGNRPPRLGFERDAEYCTEPIDTTFAVYSPKIAYQYLIGGYRRNAPYMARHLPWHIVLERYESTKPELQIPIDEEIYFYFTHADVKKSNTKERLWKMMNQYAQRAS